jgi:hypothetical protein
LLQKRLQDTESEFVRLKQIVQGEMWPWFATFFTCIHAPHWKHVPILSRAALLATCYLISPMQLHLQPPKIAETPLPRPSPDFVWADSQSREAKLLDEANQQVQWLKQRLEAAEAESTALRQQLQGLQPRIPVQTVMRTSI